MSDHYPFMTSSVACVVCGDNNEILMLCSDQQNRCPPCCIDSDYCLSCGVRIGSGGNPQFGLCFFCMPGGVMDYLTWRYLHYAIDVHSADDY